jgi:HTH-type transcriptional regulator/antitoxin HigA
MIERTPAEAFAPGEYLKDVLENRGWSQVAFAEIIGRPPRVVNEIIAGKRAVTPETARELAAALGTSAQYWLNLESAYQLSKVPPVDDRIAREAALRGRFPVRQMIQRGWIAASNDNAELEQSVLGYFGLRALSDPIVFPHAARKKEREDITELQWAWIYRVKQLASAVPVPRYSADKLRAALASLELLMMALEEIRQVPRILSECGVRFVVVEPIPGSEIQGVCFWIDGSPVIGLTLKGDYIDRFWFNLRHEIEHVLNGDGKDGPVTDEFKDGEVGRPDCERVADEAAAEFCVPQAHLHHFVARHDPAYSHINLLGFSRLMHRHPGIVAGQLQRKINRPELFKKYQVRVRPIITATALTDGYGQSVPFDI